MNLQIWQGKDQNYMKILVVDDHAEDRKILLHYLKEFGNRIIEASNGVEGLEMARSERPDLIISDALMPVMDGFEFLREVRRSAELRDIPFIFYSAVYTGDRDEELALSLGADAFLAKPLEPDEFLRQLNGLLNRLDATKKHCMSELLVEDEKYLREYSQMVAARLEGKVRELEIANRNLAASENSYRSLFNSMRDVIIISDSSRNIIDVNQPALRDVFGYEKTEVLGRCAEFIYKSEEVFELVGRTFFDQNDFPKGLVLEVECRKKSGELFDSELFAVRLFDDCNKRIGNVAVIRDISQHKRAEAELHLQSTAMQAAGNAIVITARNGKIMWVNPAFTTLTGYSAEESFGRHFGELLKSGVHGPEFYKQMWETILKGETWHGEITNRHKNGTLYVEEQTITSVKDAYGEITHFIAIKQDLTDQRKIEAQLRHAQRMESIGTLAGGIAHDFNNILTGIIGYGSMTLMKMSEDDPLRLNIKHMLEASDRAVHLTKELLLFGRKQSLDRKSVDLNLIVTRVEKFLKRVIGEDIPIHTVINPDELPVFADAYQLEQVLMNLATNARDSMPQGGTLTVTTGVVDFDREFAATHGCGKPGRYAVITVSDTGEGIDEETLERIFEPFFTTKEVGKGTGLGLAVVYGIIEQHDGHINVYSEPGHGTTFRIYLPLIASEAMVSAVTRQEDLPVGGAETILLAEDNELVREITGSVLSEFGYTVIEAVDGEDAVRKFREHAGSIDLLLLDMIMPNMNGNDALKEIRKIQPNIKAIFASGYAPEAICQKLSNEDDVQLLSKPMSPAELLRKLRSVLDGNKRSVD